jgi:hypothetical protein
MIQYGGDFTADDVNKDASFKFNLDALDGPYALGKWLPWHPLWYFMGVRLFIKGLFPV